MYMTKSITGCQKTWIFADYLKKRTEIFFDEWSKYNKKAGVMVYFGGTLDFCDVQILFA